MEATALAHSTLSTCRTWARRGPCSLACSAGMRPSSACPRPAWAAPRAGRPGGREPGAALGGPPTSLLRAWPQNKGQRLSLGPRAGVMCEAGLKLQPQPLGATCHLDLFPEPWARPRDPGRGHMGNLRDPQHPDRSSEAQSRERAAHTFRCVRSPLPPQAAQARSTSLLLLGWPVPPAAPRPLDVPP